MTSTYSDNKSLELPGYNDYVDSWNIPLNADMTVLDKALGGSTLLNATSVSGTVTLTSTQYQPLSIIISGTPTGDVYYTIPSGVGGQWTVTNNTTGAYSVYMVSAAGGSAIQIRQGYTTIVSCDGSSSGMRLSINTPSLAAGSNTQVQFNSSGIFGASANLTFDGTALTTTQVVSPVVGAAAGSALSLNANGSTKVTIDTSGNVGVGTNTPSDKLTVYGASAPAIRAQDATSYTQIYTNGGSGILNNAGSGNLLFVNNGAERMRIDPNGAVGIGTASPIYKLQVNGSVGVVNASITLNDGYGYTWGNTYITGYNNNHMSFVTNGVDRIRIEGSGNVGIGTTSPTQTLDVAGIVKASTEIRVQAFNAFYSMYNASASRYGNLQGTDGGVILAAEAAASNNIIFLTNNTERGRIDSSGNMLLGTASQIQSSTLSISPPAATNGIGMNIASNYTGISTNNAAATYNYNFAAFFQQNVLVGSIGVNTTSTSYNTSSDYRLKENVQPMTGALAAISALNPVAYDWKKTGERGHGFLAHELQAVIPEAVTGQKDAVNEDGSIKPQSVDYSKIVVHLVAALQELKAEFEAYKASHP